MSEQFDMQPSDLCAAGRAVEGEDPWRGHTRPADILTRCGIWPQPQGVNPNTMQRALAQLEAEGLVYTERTTGRFVDRRYSPFGTAAGRDGPRHDRRISRENARHRLRPGRGRKAYDGLGNKGE